MNGRMQGRKRSGTEESLEPTPESLVDEKERLSGKPLAALAATSDKPSTVTAVHQIPAEMPDAEPSETMAYAALRGRLLPLWGIAFEVALRRVARASPDPERDKTLASNLDKIAQKIHDDRRKGEFRRMKEYKRLLELPILAILASAGDSDVLFAAAFVAGIRLGMDYGIFRTAVLDLNGIHCEAVQLMCYGRRSAGERVGVPLSAVKAAAFAGLGDAAPDLADGRMRARLFDAFEDIRNQVTAVERSERKPS
jgi:hypothetical protein